DRGVGGAAADGEIVAADDHRAAVDLAAAEDEIRRLKIDELALFVVAALAGDRADLAEALRIEELVDALTHGELAGLAVALDLFGAAHPGGERLALLQLFEFGLPAHARAPP